MKEGGRNLHGVDRRPLGARLDHQLQVVVREGGVESHRHAHLQNKSREICCGSLETFAASASTIYLVDVIVHLVGNFFEFVVGRAEVPLVGVEVGVLPSAVGLSGIHAGWEVERRLKSLSDAESHHFYLFEHSVDGNLNTLIFIYSTLYNTIRLPNKQR